MVDPVIAVATVGSKERDKGAGNGQNAHYCCKSEKLHDASFRAFGLTSKTRFASSNVASSLLPVKSVLVVPSSDGNAGGDRRYP